MKRFLYLIVVSITGTATFFSCEKTESYSEIPFVEFKSYRIYDTIYSSFPNPQRHVDIVFSFVDGDGDIGHSDSLTSESRYNLFFSRYEQRNGNLINVDSLLVDSIRYSIPYEEVMKREGQNKTMKGSIKVIMQELVINYDTIQFDFYIKDRAGHKSNVASTTPITGLKKQ